MNMSRLADRAVLITGCESGIGREIARRAAAEGARSITGSVYTVDAGRTAV